MENVDSKLLAEALKVYEEKYGEGQMDLFKLEDIIQSLKQETSKAKGDKNGK